LPAPAIDDEGLGVFGDLGVQIVHEHAQCGFGLPSFAGFLDAVWGADDAGLRLGDVLGNAWLGGGAHIYLS